MTVKTRMKDEVKEISQNIEQKDKEWKIKETCKKVRGPNWVKGDKEACMCGI